MTQSGAEDYVEATAVWGEAGPSDVVDGWLAAHGLRSVPMIAGLLITGTRGQFERAFVVDLSDLGSRTIALPLPEELKPFISAIAIPKPPAIHRSV